MFLQSQETNTIEMAEIKFARNLALASTWKTRNLPNDSTLQ